MSVNSKVIDEPGRSPGHGFHVVSVSEAELQGRRSHAERGNEGEDTGSWNEGEDTESWREGTGRASGNEGKDRASENENRREKAYEK